MVTPEDRPLSHPGYRAPRVGNGTYLKSAREDHRTVCDPHHFGPDKRSPIQFSDHFEGEGAALFKAAAEIGLEGIVSKRSASRYRSGPSRSWLKTKNMVESEFVLLGTERGLDGVPWALLASDRDGELKFAGPAILHLPQKERAHWAKLTAALAMAKPPLKGLRQGSAQWLRPELRVRVRHLKAKGLLRHATVKEFINN